MKKLLTLILMFFCATSFSQTKTTNEDKHSNTVVTKIDTSTIAILPYSKDYYWMFTNCKQAQLSNSDIETIERILTKCISDDNKIQEKRFTKDSTEHPAYKLDKKRFLIDLERYKRQYVVVTNSKGEKEVWVNCFCQTWRSDWKKQILMVDDGGNCYFNLKINLANGKCYDFMVNGYA